LRSTLAILGYLAAEGVDETLLPVDHEALRDGTLLKILGRSTAVALVGVVRILVDILEH